MLTHTQIQKAQTTMAFSIVSTTFLIEKIKMEIVVIDAIANAFLTAYEKDFNLVNIINEKNFDENDVDPYSLYVHQGVYDRLIASGLFVKDGNEVLTLANGLGNTLNEVRELV